TLEEGMNLEDFSAALSPNISGIYRFYYNTQFNEPKGILGIVGEDNNVDYLKEEFKKDFAEFIERERNRGTVLYDEVLKHFYIPARGVEKNNLLSRETIDNYSNDLGRWYPLLLEYSLINKHIDLQETAPWLNFAYNPAPEAARRLEAANDPGLFEPRSKATLLEDGTISFVKVNKPFIKHDNGIYEQTSAL